MAALGFCPKRRARECESQAGVAAEEVSAGDCCQRAAVFVARLLRRRLTIPCKYRGRISCSRSVSLFSFPSNSVQTIHHSDGQFEGYINMGIPHDGVSSWTSTVHFMATRCSPTSLMWRVQRRMVSASVAHTRT